MTRLEKYKVYCEMTDAIPDLENRIRKALETSKVNYTIYTVFLSVSSEEEGTYFCDIEYGGSPEKYKRIYGNYTREAIEKFIERKENEA